MVTGGHFTSIKKHNFNKNKQLYFRADRFHFLGERLHQIPTSVPSSCFSKQWQWQWKWKWQSQPEVLPQPPLLLLLEPGFDVPPPKVLLAEPPKHHHMPGIGVVKRCQWWDMSVYDLINQHTQNMLRQLYTKRVYKQQPLWLPSAAITSSSKIPAQKKQLQGTHRPTHLPRRAILW